MANRVLWRSAIVSIGVVGLILGTAVLPQACSMKPARPPLLGASVPASVTPCVTAPSTTAAPDLGCSAPPNTFAFTPYITNTSSQGSLGPTVDSWAWASFAALNWPAQTSTDASAYPTGYVRGFPNTTDTAMTFTGAQSSNVLTWETFKEKREVFNNTVTSTQWQLSTYPPEQTPDSEGGRVPPCNNDEKIEATALSKQGRMRLMASNSKVSPALLNDPDETAEVASPAQESQNDLCLPYMGTTTYATCTANFPVPPNGGTATSIYPATGTVQNPRTPVGPRVYDPSKNIVFFEVRLNYDYFKYVLSNGSNVANPPTSTQPPYNLPWRTSANPGPGTGGAGSVTSYNAQSTVQQYGTPAATPPPVGSIQVKSAWQLLPGKPAANAPYHTTQAVHFNSITPSPGICYQVDYFALIALHIIQRVHTGTGSNAEPYGGTFIFATWELNTIRDHGGYTYVNFAAQGGADQTNPIPYPPVANALAVTTLGPDPSPLPSTIGVTNAVYGLLNANSVWKNYRLIGTQFIPTTPTQSALYNQPYYLANLVVETNRGLQNFQGLPPNITPNSQYNGFPVKNPTAYNPSSPNVAFQNQNSVPPVNMGGCMGCHGVAEVLGTAFSFVLFDGLRGAGIDTPTQVAIPPNPPPPTPPPPSTTTHGRR